MENERKRILKLVEEGKLSAEEAIVLLEALSKEKDPTGKTFDQQTSDFFEKNNEQKDSFENFFNNKELNKKVDEFMDELKKDFSKVSNRLASFMNTTFTKIKDFDLDFPFGEKVELNKSYSFLSDEVTGFDVEIPNGKVDIVPSENEQITIEAKIKTSANNEQKDPYEQDFVKLKNEKVVITSPSKIDHIQLKISVPNKHYELFVLRFINGSVIIQQLNAKLIKIKTYNGSVKITEGNAINLDVQSGNGSIDIRNVKSEDLEVQTVNGRVYIDGEIQEVEAESLNGAVVVTTTSEKARKIKARTVAGAVELYIPKTLSLNGQVVTSFGKADISLDDIEINPAEDQFLSKTVNFEKLTDKDNVLKIYGESRTGNIILRYNP